MKAATQRSCPEFGIKTVPIKFKAEGLADGEFIGYASVFGNKDSYGDVVVEGAFTNTLAEWDRSGLKIPCLWGHNTADPDFNLGECLTAVEDSHGLKVHVKLDLECPKAATTYRLLKAGRVNQMSFAYRVLDGAYIQPEGEQYTYRDAYYELRELELFEVSVVPIGANNETEILAVKSLQTAAAALVSKAGRALSSKTEDAIRGAVSQLEEATVALKGVLPDEESDDESADEAPKQDPDSTSGTASPPEAEKSSDTAALSPSVAQALIDIELLEMEL